MKRLSTYFTLLLAAGCLLHTSGTILAMKEETDEGGGQPTATDEGWHDIATWQDITPFTGKVVVYRNEPGSPEHHYLIGGSGGYSLSEEKILRVGFLEIHEDPWDSQRWYSMHRLSKQGAISGGCALTNAILQGSQLSMREATAREKVAVREALEGGKAKLDYMSNEVEKEFRAALSE